MGWSWERGRLPKSLQERELSLLPQPALSFCTFLSRHLCCQLSLPQFRASSQCSSHLSIFFFSPLLQESFLPVPTNSLPPPAIFTFIPYFPLSFLIALSLLLSLNFSLSLLFAPSLSPLSLSLCVSFSISDEGNENNRASLILSPVR